MNSILQRNVKSISELSKKYFVKNLFAFGSILREDFTEVSDIDFLVEFENIAISKYADVYFDLKFELEKLLKRKIDLLESDSIQNPYLLSSINKQKVLIYAA